jgi:alanyl aminopeptidase
VELTATSELAPGPAVITIQYTGNISKSLTDGPFQQRYKDDWYVFTKFEPVTARRAVPCFDEPSFKARWSLTLHVPKELKAFSNTPIVREVDGADGLKTVEFMQTKPLPSYLLAFAVGPLDIVEVGPVGANSVASRIIVPRGRSLDASYAASITPKLVAALEQYFGTPYPFEKLDQIAVPLSGAWGAMENAGLIAYGPSFLSTAADDTDRTRYQRTVVMAHEIAHQWFGNMVTPGWWDDIWLNEAFAEWLGNKMARQVQPEAAGMMTTVIAGRAYGMRMDYLSTSRKVRESITGAGDIASAFDAITYLKGEAVVAMYENYLGERRFQSAARTYLKKHAWGNATSNDFLEAMADSGAPKEAASMAGFLDRRGVPLLKTSVQCRGTGPATLDLRQEPLVPIVAQVAATTTWQIPVCVRYGVNGSVHRTCFLLTKREQTFRIPQTNGCPEWPIAGDDGTGYRCATLLE